MGGGEPSAHDQPEKLLPQRLPRVLVNVDHDFLEPHLHLVQERAQLQHASRAAVQRKGILRARHREESIDQVDILDLVARNKVLSMKESVSAKLPGMPGGVMHPPLSIDCRSVGTD
jgi:hypothetical protein